MKLEEKIQLAQYILSSTEECLSKPNKKIRLLHIKFYLSLIAIVGCLVLGFFGFRGMNVIAVAMLAGYFLGKTSTFLNLFRTWGVISPHLNVESLKNALSSKQP